MEDIKENIIIDLLDIVKLQHWYMDIFYEEDSDFPNYKKIGQKNRHTNRILNQITDNKEKQKEIYKIIMDGSWNYNDRTFKPICDRLRELGYIITNNSKEKKNNKQKEYYKKHKEERLKYQKKYIENNREKVRKSNKDYKERHKEEIREKKKQWYEKNKAKILAQQKEYRNRVKGNR